jgi:hypothetical protein
MFKLVLLYFELVAIFRLGRGEPERVEKRPRHHCRNLSRRQLLASYWSSCLSIGNWWPRHHKKRTCRRFKNYQPEIIFFSVSPFCGFIVMLWRILPRDYRVSRELCFSLIHYLIEYLLNSSSSFFHRIFFNMITYMTFGLPGPS